MIIDQIGNASLYCALNNRISAALRALQSSELLHAEPGRYDLDGSDVYAIVQRYETKPREAGKWESHRRYIDVQYVVSGVELMGHAQLSDMTVEETYDEARDIQFLTGQGNFFTVSAGVFTIFFPHDVHMPTLAAGAPEQVHKIVIKVCVD